MAGGSVVRILQARARPLWWRAVAARARDVTEASATRSCLVVAPHPDDETLGCGATVARKRAAGTAVRVVVVADGRSSHRSAVIPQDELVARRAAEVAEAARRLGVVAGQLTLLGLPDESVVARSEELRRRLEDVLEECRPSEVLVCSPFDWHPDHVAVNAATRAAVRRRGAAAPRLLEYPVWYRAEGPWLRRPGRSTYGKVYDLVRDPLRGLRGPRPELVRAGPHLETKRHALAAHRSQVENLTGEASWAVFDDSFLDALLGPAELFWPVI